ncbi:Probable glucan 1,3-beta-glucosidase D; AltName: Full=Exo-1,3-beta-glucanase D [Serendipita indica DSM 11827]|uniref:glucan 1,3-beta-glucosidase n=1 Tax=Serendipita indica (strain DSM 11827) TaxID=1109443 RepID=G4T796_SERID|nr:Probable glucan 1,3-beta-glucosidase D; AltName: Full=Exo-1,3-beta-glucanase D [Serendipita indica DSM 11827]CCA67129.1 related to EXG1-exo-beta-1,3-glucanase (I/II), major isoform [Serendipita indica DSM 11827]
MASHNQESTVPYDPLTEPPISPRLEEFGRPAPGFLNTDSRNSSSSTVGYRASEYGSIAALQAPKLAVTPPEGAEKENVPMRQLSPVPRASKDLEEKNELYAAPRTRTKRKALIWGLAAAGAVILIVAIAVPVAILTKKNNSGESGSDSGNSGHSGHSDSGSHSQTGTNEQTVVTSGGDGSIVTKSDGTTFVYNNTFGGFWVYDPANPLNNSARAQSWSPPLTEEWRWGVDQVYGVNLGGWLNLEPFISPALYEPFYPNAVDEWTLSTLIQQRDGNLNAIEEHYKTFIVEEDFAMIAAAGLNWVRIPIPFWAIEKYDDEPFLEKVCWQYFLKAIEWARKYGLRINLDLHAVSGSQNGWNHSGKLGDINFLNGVMGIANAQRTLDHIRIIAEFISQPEYSNVVPFFGILNEPRSGSAYSLETIQSFYAEAYRIIRNASGNGAGNGPYISIHEAFQGLQQWETFLTGADRLALDTHPYLAFGAMSAAPVESFISTPCSTWGGLVSASLTNFGMTTAGEWSNAINDCGLYVNAVGRGTRYEGTFETTAVTGSCDEWINYETWTQPTKDAFREFALSSMDALQNWFFWTWRIGESSATNKVMAPFWSYKLGLQEGWMPTDPRQSRGQCAKVGVPITEFSSPIQPGAGNPPTLDNYPWPPTTLGTYAVAQLPLYTPTGEIHTLPVPTFTQSSGATATVSVGNGWANPADNTPMAVPVAGCTYPDPWNALNAAIPACGTGGGITARAAAPQPTS